MPAIIAEPSVEELLAAYDAGVVQKDRHADLRDGSVLRHFGGAAAILWSRLARRDTDLWQAIYFASAEGNDLTRLFDLRYGFPRIEDTYGTGFAQLSRPTAAAGAGVIRKGTRLLVPGTAQSGGNARRYVLSADAAVGATAVTVRADVRADAVGAGTAIQTSKARLDDPIFDPSFAVDHLECGDGTSFESAADTRARFLATRRDARVGFVESIVAACKTVGADNALLFPSDYAGDDQDAGLNMAYVGDSGFTSTPTLVRRVQRELERWRVLGDNLQVRQLGRTDLVIRAKVYLWDSPARVNVRELDAALKGAIRGYFDGRTSGFSYDREALAGAMMRASTAIQFVTFDLPATDVAVVSLVGGRLNFPATLTRFRVRDEDVVFSFLPPL